MAQEKDASKVPGGVARAQKLSGEERSAIARRAAATRWGNVQISEAIMAGVVNIGGVELDCFVLDDETRVLSRAAFVRAIGRTGKVKGGRKYDEELQTPVFLSASNLKPFIDNDLEGNSKPIIFRWKETEMIGYRAELLPSVCNVFVEAERAGVLRNTQIHIAQACRVLERGLMNLGIVGLVDEATGYQRHRAANALADMLEKFVAKELQPWVKTFPDDFYEELYRLLGKEQPPDSSKRPQYFGRITNDIVYERLGPGIKDELKSTVPKTPSGRHKTQLHRKLTQDLGHPKLREYMASLVTIMKLSSDFDDFKDKLNSIHRKYDEPLQLDLRGGYGKRPK